MSNPLAVSAVTSVFAQLLGRVMEDGALSGTVVSMGPPDAVKRVSKERQLNLFLYAISANGAGANRDLPFRSSNGQFVGQPGIAVDLHYLVTAYGEGDDELDAHHLLAHAASLVHDNAVLTSDQIRAAQTAEPAIALSDLSNEVDQVRIVPQALSAEELSKLWGMFPTTNYRLSIGYHASVVTIERPQQVMVGPPVRLATLTVLPFRQPVIESVSPQVVGAGEEIFLAGRNLRGDDVVVRFGAVGSTPSMVTDTSVEVALPASLPAGVSTVQIVQRVALGSPPAPHRGFESNIVAFVVAPRITTPTPISVARGDALTLSFEPSVSRSQRLSVLIGSREVTAERPSDAPPATSAGFPIAADMPTGDHLLRIRVDGAESPLEVDEDPGSPTLGGYVGPIVTVTA
jgi:Pvc16 N-terminal domain/IPT/TIG domain